MLNLPKRSNLYGVYMGSNNPKKGNKYLYSIPPIDKLDYYAYKHDRGYDEYNAQGACGAILNKDVVKYDFQLSYNALKDAFSSNTSKRFMFGIGAGIVFYHLGVLKILF